MFKDYARQKAKLIAAYQVLERLLDERQEVFDRTQPGSGGSEVKSSPSNDKFDAYLIASEIIDRRIEDAFKCIKQREELLEITEAELTASKDILDKVYYLTEVRGKTTGQAAAELHYTERQVRRFLRRVGLELSGIVQ